MAGTWHPSTTGFECRQEMDQRATYPRDIGDQVSLASHLAVRELTWAYIAWAINLHAGRVCQTGSK